MIDTYIDDHPVGVQSQSTLIVDFARFLSNTDRRVADTPLARLTPSDEYFAEVDTEAAVDAGLLDPEYRNRPTWGLRSPYKRNPSELVNTTRDVELLRYITKLGSTGWNITGVSKWIGYDFDGPNHENGRSPEQLDELVDAVHRLNDPHAVIRTSKSGVGLHLLYHFPDPAPTPAREHHMQLAPFILDKLSDRAEFDFASLLDCQGKVLWHWAADAAPNGLTTIHNNSEVHNNV